MSPIPPKRVKLMTPHEAFFFVMLHEVVQTFVVIAGEIKAAIVFLDELNGGAQRFFRETAADV